MTERKRNKEGLLYHDDAHCDVWTGLTHMGLWDFKITADMVGKTFGEAIDAKLEQPDVPEYF